MEKELRGNENLGDVSIMLILICDDSGKDRQSCRGLLSEYERIRKAELTVREYASGTELLADAEDITEHADLIYIDVAMKEKSGIDTAMKLRSLGYTGAIVVYTSTPDYAIDAYDFEAFHYVVKGVTGKSKFFEILDRVRLRQAQGEKEVLVLSCAGENRCIQIDQILFFEIDQRIITVHDTGGTFSFYSTMSHLEEQLYGKGFVRTHKSYLVNRRYLAKINSQQAVLTDGTNLPVGRKYLAKMKEEQVL